MGGKKPNFATWVVMALMLTAPTAHAAVAVLEQVTGRPAIYAVGEAGARQVSLVRQGAEYVLPIEIETGPADSASFRLPDGDVAIAPGTLMRIAAPVANGADQGLMQRIFQRAGSALFSVDRRQAEHFAVETPYLVSVVKGTTFTVVVHDQGATVSLHEGRLQVADREGGQVELLPGDVAFSGREGEVQKLVGTLTRRATSDDVPSGAEPRSRTGNIASAATARSADAATSVGNQVPETTDIAAVVGDVPLAPLAGDAAIALDDLAAGLGDELSLADLGDAGDLVGSAALDAGDLGDGLGLTEDLGDGLGLTDDLDLGGADLAAGLGDDAGLIGDLTDTAGGLVDGLGDSTGDLVADLGGTTGDLVGDVGDLVGDLGDTAGDLVADLGGTTGDLVGDFGGTAGDLVDDLGGATGDLVSDLGGGAGDLVSDLGGSAGDLVGTVNEDLGDLTGGLAGTGGDLVGDLGDTTGQLVDDTTAGAGDLVGAVGDTTGGLVGGLTDTTGDLIGGLTDPDGDVVGDVTGAGGALLDDVTDATGGLVDGVTEAGGDVVSGVADAGGDLTDGLTDAAGGALGNLGGLLGRLRL